MMVVFIAGTHFLRSKNVLMKGVFGFTTFVAIVATMTSGSRGGIVALVFGIAFFLFEDRKKLYRKRILRYKYVLIAAVITILLFPFARIYNQLFLVEFGSAREKIVVNGIDVFLHNYLYGIDWGRFESTVGRAAHSNWLRTATELGIAGLLVEAFLWLLFFRLAFAVMRIAKKLKETELATILLGWTSLMFVFFVWQGFENIGLLGGTRLYYICFGFITACYAVLKVKESRAKQRERQKTMTTYPYRFYHSGNQKYVRI